MLALALVLSTTALAAADSADLCASLAKTTAKSYAAATLKPFPITGDTVGGAAKPLADRALAFAESYYNEARKICGSTQKAVDKGSALAGTLGTSVSSSSGQCEPYLKSAKAVEAAIKAIRAPIVKMNTFFMQVPKKAYEQLAKNDTYAQALALTRPGLLDGNRLRKENADFYAGKRPGYSVTEGGLEVYARLYAERAKACEAWDKLALEASKLRLRYYSCNGTLRTVTTTTTSISTSVAVNSAGYDSGSGSDDLGYQELDKAPDTYSSSGTYNPDKYTNDRKSVAHADKYFYDACRPL